ncbi:HEAT repeat domain-containing protein [Flavobacterium agrisoli]|uniref:HEAT repeat domain-containing protein n=1 Tax=Flavobacterium agrisoli TaxID=2793066 RepID=A0A934PKU3_9FLAO|nr:HEAT repeat domain-containing protein [Flavobacterium agrisoli]MBK0370017.1 HEAT repeat domain-containing protein [Flavobacterium agrisoli]
MPPFLFYIKHYFLPILVFGLVLLMAFIAFKRYLFSFHNKKKQHVTERIHSFLTSLIFISKNEIKVNEQIVLLKNQIPFHKNWCKKMLINEMIWFKENLKGDASLIVIELYKKLDLHLFSIKLLTNFRFFQKLEGLYQLQHIDYKPAKKVVKPYLKHKNDIIRSNAYACYLSLSEGKVEQLATIPREISLLNIIKLMELLHEKKIIIPTNIDEWLYSPNKSVVRLGIKTMVFYNYKNQEDMIVTLLHSEEEIVRSEAILACKELFIPQSENPLISLYLHESDKNRKEILRALKQIGSEKTIAFLKQLILYETNSVLKLLAVDTLQSLSPETMTEVSILNPDAKKILEHVTDIYIV